MRRYYPTSLLYPLIGLLVVAILRADIGADLGAMAAALKLLINGPMLVYVAAFAIVTVLLEVWGRRELRSASDPIKALFWSAVINGVAACRSW